MKNDTYILSDDELKEKLKDFPGWELKDNKIVKEFELNSFVAALDFINVLAPFFESNNHHPDIAISYKNIIFELTNHEMGDKLTNIDFLVAREIEDKFQNIIS